jgi:predicted MFS family arabinose efflux permease
MYNLLNIEPAWLVTAFAASNSVRALFYLPQVIAVARSVDGARDIALSTWWMWTLNNVLGALYTGAVMAHPTLAISFWASAAACLLTIVLAVRARRRLLRRDTVRLADSPVASSRVGARVDPIKSGKL